MDLNQKFIEPDDYCLISSRTFVECERSQKSIHTWENLQGDLVYDPNDPNLDDPRVNSKEDHQLCCG